MNWTVGWSWHDDLVHVGYDVIAEVTEAVLAFAERGEGELVPLDVPEDEPSLWKLVTPNGAAIIRADEDAGHLDVRRVLPRGPLPRVRPILGDVASFTEEPED